MAFETPGRLRAPKRNACILEWDWLVQYFGGADMIFCCCSPECATSPRKLIDLFFTGLAISLWSTMPFSNNTGWRWLMYLNIQRSSRFNIQHWVLPHESVFHVLTEGMSESRFFKDQRIYFHDFALRAVRKRLLRSTPLVEPKVCWTQKSELQNSAYLKTSNYLKERTAQTENWFRKLSLFCIIKLECGNKC